VEICLRDIIADGFRTFMKNISELEKKRIRNLQILLPIENIDTLVMSFEAKTNGRRVTVVFRLDNVKIDPLKGILKGVVSEYWWINRSAYDLIETKTVIDGEEISMKLDRDAIADTLTNIYKKHRARLWKEIESITTRNAELSKT
jgi:hypothetical protein